MDIIAMAVALKKAILQTKDIIASHFVAGTNIEITDNPDGTQTINASGEVSATDEVARQAIADHEADINNPHSVTKNQIGLGNVDNTSDADKPISTATQTALDSKQPTINSSNPLSSDSVDDTNSAHKFATAAELTQIATNTGDINTINGFLENTKIESWNIADTGRLYENTYVDIEGGGGVTHSYEPYFTLAQIEIPDGATTLYFDCTALENQDAGAYSMFFMGSFKGFIPTGKSIAIPNNSYRVDITFPYVDGDYTNKTKGKYYISFETPTGRYDTITIDGVSTNVVPKEVLDDELNGKQDTISDLATIRSNATSGSGAAEVVTGINSTANSYIEMKSGKREYLSTTVPTGNIPTGSVAMGFDEGTWTYKSGTKVSEGIIQPNEFDKTAPTVATVFINNGVFQAYPQNGWIYIPVEAGSTYKITGLLKVSGTYTIATSAQPPANSVSVIRSISGNDVASPAYISISQGETYLAIGVCGDSDYIQYGSVSAAVEHNCENLVIAKNGKKFPFYANGQPLTDYIIYGAAGGVGDKTANIITGRIENINIDSAGRLVANTGFDAVYAPIAQGEKYYVQNIDVIYAFYSSLPATGSPSYDGARYSNPTVITAPIDGYIVCRVQKTSTNAMINEGETAIPYEPYGKYKIPVICGGQTTNIYIDSPLDDGDSIYTTSQTAIPTTDGANTLICDTTVQPSKVSLTYTGWHSDLDDTTARIEALENAPAPSGGMTYDTLYEGTTASSYPYPLSHPITDYKFIIIAVGYSNVYTNTVIPVAVWSTVTSGGGNYDITVDTAQLRVSASEILPRSANNRIVYGVYGVK